MRVLFVVPARGGSKGLPGKNLAKVGGLPLVSRAARLGRRLIRHCDASSRVVCSTEDSAIAEAARTWGAEVPFIRPAGLATDGARTLDVVTHTLESLDGEFDAVVLLQPTSPLVEVEDVLGALDLFRGCGSPVVSVCRAEHPVEWHHRMDAAGRLIPVLPVLDAHQRQKLEVTYRPNGAVYVASPEQLRGEGFWGSETRGFVMPAERSVDVDTAADLELARARLAVCSVTDHEIAGRHVGPGHPCFVIAEAGVNHNGSLEMALKLVDAAAEAGADAVKFQSFKAEKVVTRGAPKAEYQIRATGSTESQFEMIRRLELDEGAHSKLVSYCAERGIAFLSTPFDEGSADLLESLGVPAFKLPSGEVTNLPFLRHVARKGRPMILSTGMSTLEEVARAVEAITAETTAAVALLQCVSNYPADPADVNLLAMRTMHEAFGLVVGYSDHTLGNEVAFAAVALGAHIVEKHFTLDRSLPGPDHAASAEPEEIAALVAGIRKVEAALGDGVKRPARSEANTARVARRSLVAACAIPAGTRIDESMIVARRPGGGMLPDQASKVVGRRSRSDLEEGALLEPGMFE